MSFLWRWVPDLGAPYEGEPLPSFPTQADAEAWLTSSYLELSDAGVESVSLYEADRLVYGPMSLSA